MAKRRKRTSKQVPAKGRLRDMADRLWSLAIRDDWGNKCAVCDRGKCEAHHLIPRQHEITRYDLQNGIALCSHHHQFDADCGPHLNAAGWLLWLSKNHPTRHAWYTSMTANGEYSSFTGTKNPAHYIEIIQRLKEYVEESELERVCGTRFSQLILSGKFPLDIHSR